jgi:hypothetical protein
MSLTEITVEGTINADRTLELDENPSLAPGRVTGVLRRQSAPNPPPQGNWFQHLQRLRAEREASGYPFMNEEEVTAHVEWLRNETALTRCSVGLREAGND